jgi:hypothetical protein
MDKSLYIAYVSGAVGSTVVLYYIGNGIIAGVDVSGMKYDGAYRIEDDGSYEGNLIYTIPRGVLLITGQLTTEEQKIELPFILPKKFWDGQVVRIDSPVGPVNAKFEKLKDLPS